MAFMVRQFGAQVPANTPQSAPVTYSLNTGFWDIESIDLEVPPGPAGLMGFQLWIGGSQWIPYEPNQWLVWDDVEKSWPMNDQPLGVPWSIVAYNSDAAFSHGIVVRFHINQVSTPTVQPTVTIATPSLAPLAGAAAF